MPSLSAWARGAVCGLALLLGATRALAAPALYALEDPRSGGMVWLFPVVHALPPGLDWRTPEIARAFDAAESVVLETTPQTEPEPPPLPARLPRDAERWAQDWSPALTARLRALAQAGGLDAEALLRAPPVYAALALAPRAPWGGRTGWGVEAVLADAAREAGKPVIGLEPTHAFGARVRALAPADARDWLALTLSTPEDFPQRLAAAWSGGDVQSVTAWVIDAPQRSAPGAFAELVTGRHHAWIGELAARRARGERIFVAMGAAHVYGEAGVLAGLRTWDTSE